MADHMQKVRSGNPLVIPAQAYNAFIDAAEDYRRRTSLIGQKAEQSFRQASIVLVRNDSGSNQNRLAALGIDAPIISLRLCQSSIQMSPASMPCCGKNFSTESLPATKI